MKKQQTVICGILVLVIIILSAIAIVHHCKQQSKKETETKTKLEHLFENDNELYGNPISTEVSDVTEDVSKRTGIPTAQ